MADPNAGKPSRQPPFTEVARRHCQPSRQHRRHRNLSSSIKCGKRSAPGITVREPRGKPMFIWIKRFIFVVPQQASSRGEWGREGERNRPLPLQPGKRATCKRVHAEPGIKCNSVSLPTGFAQRHWLRRRRCPCQPANEATDGINATGSKVYFRRARPPKPAVFDGERNVDKLR